METIQGQGRDTEQQPLNTGFGPTTMAAEVISGVSLEGKVAIVTGGSSTTINEGRPEYDSTVGAAARFQRDYNGAQPGDPAKAATVIIRLAELDEPPLRLLLGSDAVRIAEDSDLARLEADKKWRDLSVSTDFGLGSGPGTS